MPQQEQKQVIVLPSNPALITAEDVTRAKETWRKDTSIPYTRILDAQ